MSLTTIAIPDSIRQQPHDDRGLELIDLANERIEAFMLADQVVIENFVTCDFHLVEQALAWLHQNHLLTGNRFCELGSGFGVVTMLASILGMQSMGIEIEPSLVEQSSSLADHLQIESEFYCGSFVPRGIDDLEELSAEMKHVDTDEGDVFEELGLAMDDFDLFFAFPWPGEHVFFEALLDTRAAAGAILMTYRGREGIHLVRKD